MQPNLGSIAISVQLTPIRKKLMVSISEMGFHPWYRWIRGSDAYAPGDRPRESAWNQVISNTGYESPCSTKGKSCRFSPLWSKGPHAPARGFLLRMAELSVAFSPPSLRLLRAFIAIPPRPSGRGILAKESNGPLLHGGNPIGFVPASRGGVYIESMQLGFCRALQRG